MRKAERSKAERSRRRLEEERDTRKSSDDDSQAQEIKINEQIFREQAMLDRI
jgi:hypothetical protein